MSLNLRDSSQITPTLRDNGAGGTSGDLDSKVVIGAAKYFTEPIIVGTYIELLGLIDITAQSGTSPTLDVSMQYGYKKADGSFRWIDSGDAFAQITTTLGVFKKAFTANFGKYIRFGLLMGGTTPQYTVTMKLMAKG